MELRPYLAPLVRWWWLLLIATILGGGSAYLATRQQPEVYKASSILMIGRSIYNPNPSGTDLFLSQELANLYSNFAQREPVREATMSALDLSALPEYKVQPLANGQFLQVEVIDPNPALTQAVANELAKQLILYSPSSTQEEEEAARQQFIDRQLTYIEGKIAETEAEIAFEQEELGEMTSARQIAQAQEQIAALQTKLSTLQTNYANLVSTTDRDAANVLTVIEAASLPTTPVRSNKFLIIAATALASFALAAGAAHLIEFLDDTIKTPPDVSSATNLRTLSGIGVLRGDDLPSKVITVTHPLSSGSEAFRLLRTGIQSQFLGTSKRSLLVSSPSPGDGKSMVAANLAVSMAQAGYDVLLVDTDLHLPTQHEFFELSNDLGLADILADPDETNGRSGEITSMLQEAIQPSGVDGLQILTSGSLEHVPSDLLGTARMSMVLAVLSALFEFVVLDSPAVLAVSDTVAISTQVDGVLLVVDSGRTRRSHLSQVVDRLRQVNAVPVGAVLNRLSPKHENYFQHSTRYMATRPDGRKRTRGIGGRVETPVVEPEPEPNPVDEP